MVRGLGTSRAGPAPCVLVLPICQVPGWFVLTHSIAAEMQFPA
jgi:hypothetical protein